jgi:hypothetical protein
MSRTRVWRWLWAIGLGALLMVPAVAWAHAAVDSGSYHFEVGWVNEPVIVGERNALDLFVAPKDHPDQGLAGVEATLQFTVEYGGVNQSYDLVPVENEPGHYSAVFIPTRLGQYTFHLTGQIKDEKIDVSVKPEEVVAAGKLDFPEALPAVADLQAQLAAAQGQTNTALLVGISGLAFGLIGLAVALYVLLKRK